MGFLKRAAFYLGLMLGLAAVAAAGTVALTYLFTGKFPAVARRGGFPGPVAGRQGQDRGTVRRGRRR